MNRVKSKENQRTSSCSGDAVTKSEGVLVEIKPSSDPKYKETKVFTFPNMIVRVHIPDIDDEENERRMKDLKKAVEDYLRVL